MVATTNNSGVFVVQKPNSSIYAWAGWGRVLCAFFSGQFVDRASLYSKKLAPILNTKAFVAYGDNSVGSRISGLLFTGGPAAIFRFIISIIVNSVNRVSPRWSRSHIRIKALKAFQPPFADCDPAPAPEMVARVVFVVAPILHSGPCAMFRCMTLAMAKLVFISLQDSCCAFQCQTAATEGGFSDIGCRSDRKISAVALAGPHDVSSVWDRGSRKNRQSSKLFASKIESFWHSGSPNSPEYRYA